jgi:RND family efflux transporter MFP subunit
MIRWFVVICVMFGVIGVFNLLQRRSEHQVLAEQTDRLAVPVVAVIHPRREDSDSTLDACPAISIPTLTLPIYARTNGYLKKWYKDIGSHVKQGDLLADIDTPEVDRNSRKPRRSGHRASQRPTVGRLTAARYQELLKSDAVSKQEVDNFNGDYAAKQAMVPVRPGQRQRLEDLESFKNVYAPFSGVITARNVDIGTLINAGNGGTATKEMFDLAQTDPLRVYVSVPQTFAPSMRAGTEGLPRVSLNIPAEKFCGQVARTSDAIDPSTRTLLTEVDVPNPKAPCCKANTRK